eukprot:gene26658-29259_t
MITTLLGSCIAACLFDPVAHVGGTNHFLLGEPNPAHHIQREDLLRYGVHAMELLINGMMAKGAQRPRLRGPLYGGGNIISGLGGIGSSNAAFARRFMQEEGIPLGHVDLGGSHARKVEFIAYEGKARSIAVVDARIPEPVRPQLPLQGGDLELF